jgi:hypothetical protein
MHANQLKIGKLQKLQLTPVRPVITTGEDHVWFEDWWMVASLCDE